eukprot:1026497-Rhodomonas_salina.3
MVCACRCTQLCAGGAGSTPPIVLRFRYALSALVRQYFTEGWYDGGFKNSGAGFSPSAALLKAMLVNSGSARKLAYWYKSGFRWFFDAGFDERSGYGRPTLDNVLWFADTAGSPNLLARGRERVEHGAFREYTVQGTGELLSCAEQLVSSGGRRSCGPTCQDTLGQVSLSRFASRLRNDRPHAHGPRPHASAISADLCARLCAELSKHAGTRKGKIIKKKRKEKGKKGRREKLTRVGGPERRQGAGDGLEPGAAGARGPASARKQPPEL